MRRSLLACVALAALACQPPPVVPSADARQNTLTGRIEGDVVINSAARGDVVLFLYDAERPPPPAGTGRPRSFAVVPSAAAFAHAGPGEVGPYVAPFAFSLVPPGRYLIQGFVDVQADFIPWYQVTAGPNAGDVGGAALDPASGRPRVVAVGLDADGVPVPALGVTVGFSDAALVPVDRPVFSVGLTGASVTLGAAPLSLRVLATPISEGPVAQPAPVFLARLVDADGDGVPDDADGDGVPDFWPKVVVRKLADGGGLDDENDADGDGLLDEGGADYAHVDPGTGAVRPPDGAPDLVVLAAGFDVAALLPRLVDGDGRPLPGPVPLAELPLVVRPLALDASKPGRPEPLASVPQGRYAVTLIQLTGQTWRVPNELAPGLGGASELPTVASQAFTIEVR